MVKISRKMLLLFGSIMIIFGMLIPYIILNGVSIQQYFSMEDIKLLSKQPVAVCVPRVDENLSSILTPLNVTIVDSLQNCNIIAVSGGYLSQKPLDLYYALSDRIAQGKGFVFIIYGAKSNYRLNFLGAWLKSLTKNNYRMPLMLANASFDKKSFELNTKIYNSDLIAFSFKPFGISIVEKIINPASDVAWIINNFLDTQISNKLLVTNYQANQQDGITVNGFTFIGYIGWRTANAIDNNGKIVGVESVKIDYYYTYATTANGKYEFFLAHVWHSAYGDLCWSNWLSGTHCYAPKNWISVTNWQTTTWPGQVLDDWGPKNTGSNTQITYSISASAGVGSNGPSVSAGATVSYSVPGGLVINWQDYTHPQDGYVQTNQQIPNSACGQPGPTYTLEPASIGFLDPTKTGGFEPMIVYHDFQTIFQDGYGDSWGADLNFTVALYSTYVAG